jgi:signal transduction histidine kinase/DNA-binding response OmpR family regulator
MPNNIKYSFFIVFIFLCACQQNTIEKKYTIGFSQCCNDPWRDVMNSEMSRELTFHPEVRFEMRMSDNNSDKQVEQIREMVKKGIDLLIVSPNESKPLTAVIEEVYKSGIAVILIDRKTESELYTAYIGANNYEVGKTAGKYIGSQIKGTGHIIELQMQMTMSPAIERHKGFRDAVATIPHLKIVEELEMVNGMSDLEKHFSTTLQQHPEVNIVFGQTDLLAETAYKIAQDQDRAKGIFFVGIDGIPGTGRGIQAVEDGILNASMLYPTGGAEAIQLALSVLNHLPFEKQNDLQTIVINSDNARILHNQMKKVNSLQESIDKQVKNLDKLKIIYDDQRVYIGVLLSSLFLVLLLGAGLWRSLQTKKAANRSLELKNQEILAHEQQIVEMSAEVSRATQAKVDFFTNISHEFRTPLTLILGFAEDLLPSQKLSKDMHQSIGYIQRNAFRLLRLVNQLMDFRKTESDQMKLRASENDFVAFVRNIMESYGKMAVKRHIDFQLLSRDESLMVWFDAHVMDKVLFNLLSNAFKFTPDNGKIQLMIFVDAFENTVKLTVEDTGKGMTEEEVKHVFDAFYQGQDAHFTGTGLGLSLSKALVKMHGGKISLQSTKGTGSRFIVALPLGKAHLSVEQMVLEPHQAVYTEGVLFPLDIDFVEDMDISENTTAAQQILIIEDNEELQFFLKKKFAATYQILSATDGNEGIQKAYDFMPDLIICDIMLPSKNGLEITKILKSDLRTSHIPIILLSAQSTIEQQIKGTEMGADAYMTKPFNVQFLEATIKSLLLNRQILRGGKNNAFTTSTPTNLNLPENSNQIDRDFITNFVTYIDKNYARQDFQVADLSQEFGLSRSQLYRKVTALLGETMSDYIQNVRLKKAEELLLENKLTVAEIAYQVGYSSPDYFSTVFKSKYNVAPSQFKKSKM